MAPPYASNAGDKLQLALGVTVAIAPAACGPSSSEVEEAGAMVLYVAPPVDAAVPLSARPAGSFVAAEVAGVRSPLIGAEPMDVIPLSVRPPAPAAGFAPEKKKEAAKRNAPATPTAPGKKKKKAKLIATAAPPAPKRQKPEWLSRFIQEKMHLRVDLPAHFIDEKVMTHTDLDAHQNRFRIPTEGALSRLREILTLEERVAASLNDLNPPKTDDDDDGAAVGEEKQRKKGKVHGGLPVVALDMNGGRKQLLLSRWGSSRGVVIKGAGYMDFIRGCGFEEGDVIEIWAFQERQFRLFGVNVLNESPLYILMVNKTSKSGGEQHQPVVPMPPAAPAADLQQ